MARGITSTLRTAVIAGAIGFGAGVYLVPSEKADQFRAIVQSGLGAIDRVVHSDKVTYEGPCSDISYRDATRCPGGIAGLDWRPDSAGDLGNRR
jgi:hypothetical protein